MLSTKLITVYYLSTPLFWLLDAAFDADLRAAALDGSPFWKLLYYGFCFLCGAVLWRRPALASAIGLAESSLNILLLLLGLLLPYFRVIDELAAGAPVVDGSAFAAAGLASFVLSGLVWVASFHLHFVRIRRGPR